MHSWGREVSSSIQTGQTLLLKARIPYSENMFLFIIQAENSFAISAADLSQSQFILPPSLPPQ